MHFTWTLKYTWKLIYSNHDGDGQEKISGYISEETTLHVHQTFLYISLPFLHDLDVKLPSFFCT